MDRSSGILLHISSLPSRFGIGDLGPKAYDFVDFCVRSRQSYWQILPLTPTEKVNGHSPYTSISTFAWNPLFISPEKLVEDGFLLDEDLEISVEVVLDKVDFDQVESYKMGVLKKAYQNYLQDKCCEELFLSFIENHKQWLDDFALFVVIKNNNDGQSWTQWDRGLSSRDKNVLDDFVKKYVQDIEEIKFQQFIFWKQWSELKTYCVEKGLKIIGDVPIYVNLDSVDVWKNPELFKIGKDFKLSVVAGVPPDYFSSTGQRWGNPVYNWDVLKKNKYDWWIDRILHNLKMCDVVRIDHFRGLVNYWEIKSDEKTAVHGEWKDVPHEDFFKTLKEGLKEYRKQEGCFLDPDPIIAEDLGIITDEVKDVMKRQGFPGMKVLLFAFSDDLEKHPYLPHNCEFDSVIYPGTHDNNTVVGWYKNEATEKEKENLEEYLGKKIKEEHIHWDFMGMAMNAISDLCILSLQDVLGLDEKSRMNTPGTLNENWVWRLSPHCLLEDLEEKLADMTYLSDR